MISYLGAQMGCISNETQDSMDIWVDLPRAIVGFLRLDLVWAR